MLCILFLKEGLEFLGVSSKQGGEGFFVVILSLGRSLFSRHLNGCVERDTPPPDYVAFAASVQTLSFPRAPGICSGAMYIPGAPL